MLGCTHFLFYKEYIKDFVKDGCFVVDGNLGTARHLREQLLKRNLLNQSSSSGEIEFFNSQIKKSNEIDKLELSKKIYNMFY